MRPVWLYRGLVGAWLLCGAGPALFGLPMAGADEPGPVRHTPVAPVVRSGQSAPPARQTVTPTVQIGPAVRQAVDQSGDLGRLLQQRLRDGNHILPPDWSDQGHIQGRWLAQTLIRPGEELLVHLAQPVAPGSLLLIYRPGALLTDPATGENIGRVAHTLGRLRITGDRVDQASWRAQVMTIQGDVQVGDRLLRDQEMTTTVQPHTRVPVPVRGRILAFADGVEMGGAGQVVVVGVGRRDRVSPGLVLTIHHTPPPGIDPVNGQAVRAGPYPIGSAALFLIGERASFALLGPTIHPVVRGDEVASY
ncbi:MAG: hypothetical protein H7838_06570 [Magnetococcus sp. DMHC-8]